MAKPQQRDLLYAAVILALATALCRVLSLFHFDRESLLVIYILGVQCCACCTHGYRYSIAQAIASMTLFNYFYTEPLHTLAIKKPGDAVLLFFFLATAVLSAGLTVRLRDALENSRRNEALAEQFNKEKEGALLEAERAQLKSSLLRSIGHDLRTPLTGIQCGANYVAEHADTLSREDIRRMEEDISCQITWLINMVENILYMTRLDNDRLQASEQEEVVDDVVNEAVSHVPSLADRDFAVSLPPDFATVSMDGRMIVQVLVNLLDNAVRYSPPDKPIRLSVRPEPGRMLFCVEDGGPGIPEDQRERIFDSFVTSGKVGSDGRKGMGLGLAICRAAILAHRGEIGTGSSALGGAKFWFWLPAGQNSNAAERGVSDGTQSDSHDR